MDPKQQIVTAVAEDQIVRYLLHEMNEEERSSLEDRLAREPSLFEVIAATEDDMIMKYVRGNLDSRLLPRFEEIYLHSPGKRARVDQARLLQQAVRDAARSHQPGLFTQWLASPAARLRFAIYSVAAAAVILSVVLLTRWMDHPFTQQPLQNTSLLQVSLSPGLVRGAAGVQIVLPAGTRLVQFELALPQTATGQTYHAILQTPERPEVWNGPAARKGQAAVIGIPTDLLTAGDYMLQLQGTGAGHEGIATYYFRVLK